MKYPLKSEIVDPSLINKGDTVIIEGKEYTIGNNDIKSGFMGTTIRGMQFRNGIERVLFPKYKEGQFSKYVAQI